MRILAGRMLGPLARHLRRHARECQTADDMEALLKVAKRRDLLVKLEEMVESRAMDGSGLRAAAEHLDGDSWSILQWFWDHREQILALVLLILKVI